MFVDVVVAPMPEHVDEVPSVSVSVLTDGRNVLMVHTVETLLNSTSEHVTCRRSSKSEHVGNEQIPSVASKDDGTSENGMDSCENTPKLSSASAKATDDADFRVEQPVCRWRGLIPPR